MNYLIIGNGVAGTEAALAIRKSDPEGAVAILTSSPYLYYYRPSVIEYLADGIARDRLIIYKPDFYEKNRIRMLLGTTVAKLMPDEKAVLDIQGRLYSYDRLLLATGADPVLPPIEGADLNGVFTLRGIEDADRLRAFAGAANRAVVVGGGLLGLESAHSLAKLGLAVSVVEACGRLLPRQLDADGARTLQRLLEEKGLSFALEDGVRAIEGNGSVKRVLLKSGRTIEADLVLVSAGIRGRCDLAREAGIAVDSGIVVDDHLRTSAEDVFAAGDPIEYRGKLFGIWPAAKEQGRIAGLNMAGVPTAYNPTLMAATLKITGIDLYSAGDFNAAGCDVLVASSDTGYKKLLLNAGLAVGAIALGDRDAVKAAQRVMDGKGELSEFRRFF
ncbi:MAG TPA: FAD-dependent oxidoreductase [Spirochaetota bacterium]|nr:FAD-dependent oxidoreductase [Spirochaetota bacterium]